MERSRLIIKRSTVRRRLFDGPVDTEFLETQKKIDMEEERRFKRKWNLDGVENDIQWTEADSNIPEVYTKGYSHVCKRRAVRPSVGKSLSFTDSDNEDSCVKMMVHPSSPVVQYYSASSVDVFIGLLHNEPQNEQITPKKNNDFDGSHSTEKSENRNSNASGSSVSSQCLRKLTQKRLTDMWRVLKRRQGSLSSSGQQLHKRARVDRL